MATITGTNPNGELLQGTSADDFITGLGGNDTLRGLGGNDVLDGGFGSDVLDGGTGTDWADYRFFNSSVVASLATGIVTFPGFLGQDTLVSIEHLTMGNGDDTLTGNAEVNAFFAGGGNDILSGGDGDDQLHGDAGNDQLTGGNGNDQQWGDAGGDYFWGGGPGNNTIDGGADFDILDYQGSSATATVDMAAGTATGPGFSDKFSNIEMIVGSAFGDTLTGDAKNNELQGLGGNDVLRGGDGDDNLRGQDGDDRLDGGFGSDLLEGGPGNDTADYLFFDSPVVASLATGFVTFPGFLGQDTLQTIENLTTGGGADTLTGDGNANVLLAGGGNDLLNGGGGNDQLFGEAGNDTLVGGDGVDQLLGGSGDDILDGGPGIDQAVYTGAPSAVTVNLFSNVANGGDGNDSLVNVEDAIGSAFNDTLIGGTQANNLQGRGGNDTLSGGDGDDQLFGEDGDDVLDGGFGFDLLDGGAGTDTATYLFFSGSVAASLTTGVVTFTGGGGQETLQAIENLTTGAGVDTLTGDGNANILRAGASADALNGGGGNDQLFGEAGDDSLTGAAGDDALNGGDGSDTAVYSGPRSSYVVAIVGAGFTVTSATEGVDTLTAMEFARFSDQTLTLSALDTIAPTAATFSPANGSVNAAVGSNIVVSFNEIVQRGIGTVLLKTAAGVTVESFDAAGSNRLTVSGATLTIDPTLDLNAGAQYFVEIGSGSVKDTSGNAYAGLLSGYSFVTQAGSPIDATPPAVATFSPANGSVNAAVGSNILVSFNEIVQRGSGIVLLKTAAGVTVESFDAASSGRLTVSGATLTIDPTLDLNAGTQYFVDIGSGSVKDPTGNAFAGVTSGYSFVTQAGAPIDTTPPTVATFNPANGSASVAVASNIVVSFSEIVQRGSGIVLLKTAAGATVESFDAASSGRLTVSGASLTIDPTVNLSAGTQYFVDIGNGSLKDTAGNAFAGLSSAYSFVTQSASIPNLVGTSRNDALVGTPGNDTLNGQAGDDSFEGGAGNDTLNGGSGLDTAWFVGVRADYRFDLAGC